MYITIKAYNNIKPETEDFDTIPLAPTGIESKSLKEGMYLYEGEFGFEVLYDQFNEFKKKLLTVVGPDPVIEAIDIGSIIGPAELKAMRSTFRNKAVEIIDVDVNDDEYIFTFTHFMKALDVAAYEKGVILIK